MNSNLVSIVTAVHNGATFLEKTIQSVLDQSYTTWELILIDDASTDNSKDIIEKYKRIDERISSFYNKINLGPGETRNIGIKEAKGKYLAFLDSDDRWHENKLAEQIKFMQDKSYSFTYTLYSYHNEQGNLLKESNTSTSRTSYKNQLLRCSIGCSTVIIDIESLGKKYMPSIRNRQDWALWLGYLKVTDYAYGISKPLTMYTVREGSLSSSKTALIKYHWKIYREILSYNLFTSMILFTLNIGLLSYHHFIIKRTLN